MQLTQELASKVLTGLSNGSFETDADEPAEGDEGLQEWVDEIARIVGEGGENGKSLISAVAAFVEKQSDHVASHELDDYIQEHYQGAGFNVGETLQKYAEGDEVGDLGKLYDRLDKAGGVDYFDWSEYADSGSSYMSGFRFIVVPTTGTAHSVFLFSEG